MVAEVDGFVDGREGAGAEAVDELVVGGKLGDGALEVSDLVLDLDTLLGARCD